MEGDRILIVDDEKNIRHLIGKHLTNAGLQYREAADGLSALHMMQHETFDLILLDLMMDGADGMDVLRHARSLQLNTPIIIVSALHDIDKKIESLGLGADDYMTKPFVPSELVARITANIRRSRNMMATNRLQVGEITLHMSSQTVEKHGVRQSLSPTEYKLLLFLMRHPGHILTKEDMYEAVWKHDHFDANNLSVYMNYLRKK
ncbi:response regulator transcription factor [Bacillaceae bacterium SIJ1]|uniref:response regulator transcription factor n=1 Tax=Litoribacterium kuwaitense TaxID=1398745 RepID=UPI0013EC1AAA|nr:response regulator transcription factor [Litoribacterium kuwaitense]NGP44282.1 response regulator transcription factor [Litoribacterium kuwaitense]